MLCRDHGSPRKKRRTLPGSVEDASGISRQSGGEQHLMPSPAETRSVSVSTHSEGQGQITKPAGYWAHRPSPHPNQGRSLGFVIGYSARPQFRFDLRRMRAGHSGRSACTDPEYQDLRLPSLPAGREHETLRGSTGPAVLPCMPQRDTLGSAVPIHHNAALRITGLLYGVSAANGAPQGARANA